MRVRVRFRSRVLMCIRVKVNFIVSRTGYVCQSGSE